jgi:hypothetical protein
MQRLKPLRLLQDYKISKNNEENPVAINDVAKVMFLTKYIGNYNITKLGNKFMLENKGHAIIMEKLQ